MKARRFIKGFLASLAAVLIVAGVCAGSTWLYLHPHIERINGVVYGQREGRNLTLDVIRPAKTNGLGVVMMVSGGWKSATPGAFPAWMLAPLLRRGYTVFAVCHISQPEATVMFHSNLPPILIYHGDADTLVPLDQSERFQTEARKLGCTVRLVVHHGGGHGWWSMVWNIRRFAAWFDQYLGKVRRVNAVPF